ncbi:hypothetical protein BX661DRAFT_206075 [Kickxella alabastrina]|uniref:uncharacterized protein n=1 Tax=Kickxella alabastrina TaxID=61397 RepID=UPI00221FF5A7|nr:uncharacterized protein BX661DRAFT_206075 [Kickxella alabastrina]KAI7825784.1 hypothetical protein BX661DRAFT_206075 [Kickxella alabastrina]
MPPPAATGGISRRTSRFLPPQHPSIGRYRSALAEYQSNQPAKSSASKVRPKNPYSPIVPVKRPLPEDDGLFADENMSIMRDDRSFMDLLSPTKLESTAYDSKSAVIESGRRDILSSLSRASGTAALEVESRVRQSLLPVETRSEVQSTGNIGAGRHSSFSRTDYERDSAKPQPREPFERSMAAASESLEPSPIAQPLQSDRSSMDLGLSATLRPSTARLSCSKTCKGTVPTPTPTPKAAFAVQTETALPPDTATAAVRAPAASTAGLGSISSSVLQNLLSDALAPLREQISGEIRNLHLDMIRQNFVYQEQIDALRQECNEAKVLRQEMEQLRRENEQLKRYVPFYNFVEDGNARPAKPNNDRVPDAARPV